MFEKLNNQLIETKEKLRAKNRLEKTENYRLQPSRY
jgi:hypothetical protein